MDKTEAEIDSLLSSVYFNPEHPSGFSGAYNLINSAKKELNLSKDTTENWLRSQDAFTMHKRVVKQFQRQKTLVSGIDDQWQIDLTVLPNLSKYNDNFKYLLCCIDVFSKFAWVVPLKTKLNSEIVTAFEKIFLQTDRRPNKICSDAGGEFLGSHFQGFLKDNNIGFFTTFSEKKASICERFQRTLKQRLWRYFRYSNTYRYLDILSKVVSAYNNSKHRTIGMAPIQVNEKNSSFVYKRLYGTIKLRKRKPRYFVNQPVRINSLKNVFAKGYEGGWTEEIFKVDKIYSTFSPIMYRVRDHKNEVIKGRFYEQELQAVNEKADKLYKIEKILDYKTVRGKKFALVKWLGYHSSSNSWEPLSEVKKIQSDSVSQ
jgi:hypothetical protein